MNRPHAAFVPGTGSPGANEVLSLVLEQSKHDGMEADPVYLAGLRFRLRNYPEATSHVDLVPPHAQDVSTALGREEGQQHDQPD